jgi:hypothetical protein
LLKPKLEIIKTSPNFALILKTPSKSVKTSFLVPLTATLAPIKGNPLESLTTPSIVV